MNEIDGSDGVIFFVLQEIINGKTDTPTSDKAVQTEVKVNVKYIFEDVKVYKKEKSDLGTYILLAFVVAGALGGGYYSRF